MSNTEASPSEREAAKITSESLLKNSDFLSLMVGRASTTSAFQILSVSLGWHIYERTGQVLYLGLIGLFMFLPFLCLFLAAGLAADRFDRRVIIVICNALDSVVVGAIGFYFVSGVEAVWPVFPLLFLAGGAQAFLNPAIQATLPNLVPRAVFARAVAATSLVTKSAQLGAPVVAGLLIAWLDERVYFAAVLLFLLAALSVSRIRTDLRITGPEPFGLHMILAGFRHIWRTKPVLAAVSIDLIAVLFGGVMGLLPVFAIDILRVGPHALGLMRAMPAVGALLVAASLARSVPFRIGTAFFASLAVFGFAILVFSLSQIFIVSLIALGVYGAADMVSVFVRQTLVQVETPNNLRGRVSSVNSVAINASNQLGDFRGGVMAGAIGAPAAVLLGAGVVLGVTVLWYKLFPSLRHLDHF